MATDVRRTELKITGDARMRAALRAALEHLGELHGFTKEERLELADAAEKACGKMLMARAGQEPRCIVIIDEQEDSIEVKIESAEAGAPQAFSVVRHFQRNPVHS